ncbi:MAG: hypothetical protein CMJ64_05230 [Planctomycetaceae bacterium]|nr:hypothetical protein [Planctomycetaceae bacterium]
MSQKLRVWVGLALLAVIITAPPAAADGLSDAVPVLGERFSGQLVGVSEDWQVAFSTGAAERQLPLRQLVRWGNYSDKSDGTQILLSDGSVLPAKVLRLASDSLVIDAKLWGEVSFKSTSCRGVIFACSGNPLERDRQWDRIRTAPAAEARLFLRNGDEISGQLTKGSDEDDDVAAFGIELVDFIPPTGMATSFDVSQVQMLALESQSTRLAPVACSLGFTDGSLLAVSMIRRDGEMVAIELACGVRLRANARRMWQRVSCIESQQAEVTYLSDLRPADYKHFPFLTVSWPLGVDKNVLGGRLRSGGYIASKGLGVHARARLVYNLDRWYSRLEAELALDDQAGRDGSVVFRIFVERPEATARKWNLAYTSPIVRGSNAAIPISIDVTNATRVALAVETADLGDTLDHANWLHARLVSASD